MNIIRPILIFLVTLLGSQNVLASESWQFQLTSETEPLTKGRFYLNTAADMNGNGVKELVVADFGRYGDHAGEWRNWEPHRNLHVLEWDKRKLNILFHKRSKEFSKVQNEANQLVVWPHQGRVMVESIPPYLGLEWKKGKYHLYEQKGQFQKTPLVGSWAIPWTSPFCYKNFAWAKKIPPHECVVGIRDFSGTGQPKIVTVLEKVIVKDKKYEQTLRVRRFEPGFLVEWEQDLRERFVWTDPNDRFNSNVVGGLYLRVFRGSANYLIRKASGKNRYELKRVGSKKGWGLTTYDLPDIYFRESRKKDQWEYWGYHRVDIPHPDLHLFRLLLRNAALSPDYSRFITQDVKFPTHKNFLSVGFFRPEDIDADGLDEIILVEETGREQAGAEHVSYYDTQDYIRILKWNGKKYQTMWISPPYTKRGTKFLVEDIKGTGKKQLIVLSPYGTVQIWERR